MKDLSYQEQKRVGLIGVILVVISFAIFLPTLWMVQDSLANSMLRGASSFAAVRTMVPVAYLDSLPIIALSEFVDSKEIKKRSFRPRNILIGFLLFGEYCLLATAMLTVFDLILGHTSFVVQFPLLALSVSLPLVLTVLIFKVNRLRPFFRKAFG